MRRDRLPARAEVRPGRNRASGTSEIVRRNRDANGRDYRSHAHGPHPYTGEDHESPGAEIEALLQAGPGRADRFAEIGGNVVRLRLVGHASGRTHRFIGCVHNPDIDAVHLLDLVEQWLRS